MADCGPINPLSGLTSHINTFSSSVQEVKPYNNARASAAPSSQLFNSSAAPLAHNSANVNHFVSSFHNKPFQRGPSHPADLTEQFINLNIGHHHHQQQQQQQQHNQQQIAEFERAFHASQHQLIPSAPTNNNWASEYSQHNLVPNQQRYQHPAAAMQHRLAAANMLHNQVVHQPHMQWAAQYGNYNPMPQQQFQSLYQQTKPSMLSEESRQFESLYGSPVQQQQFDPSASKQAQTPDEPWVNEYETSSAGPQQSMAGGLDSAMLQQLMSSDDPKWKNSKFLKFINKISKGEIEFRDNQAIEKSADQIAAEQQAKGWQEQFTDQMNSENNTNPASQWQSEFESAQAELLQKSEAEWAEEFKATAGNEDFSHYNWQEAIEKAKAQVTQQKDPEYSFQENNPYSQQSNAFEQGVELLNQGKLKEAIKAFESAVQQNSDHSDAWAYLGQAQAENEEESNAIAALLKAVSIDPYNLKALLMLGVSYTNDLEEHRALNYLKTWLENNPEYQSQQLQVTKQQTDEYLQFYSQSNNLYDINLHDQLMKMFQTAAAQHPQDSELYTVIGVLYHISNDYDKAIESFKHALKLNPNDSQLWNKLGATQANSNRSAEAVYAYQRALQIRPGYVRALANLAIAYANQGLHDEAVKTYLLTLTHNPNANHIWSYLRISLSHLEKHDLVELSQNKNVELFKPYYQF
jgi:peroxin-5